MDNEQENDKLEKSKPSKEDIPSWLQGLEDSEPENEIPEKSMDDVADSWVREVTDKPDNEQKQDSLETSAEDVESDKPDWLNQLLKVDSGTPAILRKDDEVSTFEDPMGNEATKKTEINDDLIEKHEFENSAADKSAPDSNGLDDDFNTEEAYIELSEFDLEENRESVQPTFDEHFENEEELPDWLQEMIAEPSETVSEISQPNLEERIEEDKGYADQMDITQETDISEIVEASEVSEIDEIADVADVEEIAEVSEIEEIAEINDLDLSPTPEMIDFAESGEDDREVIPDEVYIESPWEDNSQPIENDEFRFENDAHSQEDGNPKILRFGKYLLDQKDFEPAIEIFSNFVSQSEHLDEINTWLSEIAFDETESNSSIWELIGDIALIKSEPSQALRAYTQAINSLLHTKGLTNATD